MTQKLVPPNSWLARAANTAGKGLTAVSLLFGAGALTAGCLDRPVTPATPTTTNVYISQIRQTGVDKIDLVFMIDNSLSMADKQEILADAVPVLVQRLITPTCVDKSGAPINGGTVVAQADGTCPAGSNGVPEFKPIKDIHIGIVTSSLGDHGSNDVCSDAQNMVNVSSGNSASFYNDMGELLPAVRPDAGLYSWNMNGFLVWDPRPQADVLDKHTPITMNETDSGTFINNFTKQVTAAGEHGCGYEAQLESWYRFLVDPEPVSAMTQTGDTPPNPLTPKDVDVRGPDPTDVGATPDKGFKHSKNIANAVVLKQRSLFLRPDSLLAVIMLTDENDCSIVDEDGTQGWIVGWKGGVGALNWHMPRGNSACAANPNDKCCRPCSSPPPDSSCQGNDSDPVCQMGATLGVTEDSMNLRCFNMAKRFGVDLLYGTGRYVEALSSKFITPRFGGVQVPNPIYQAPAGQPARDPGLVFLAGIVGVPWQDIATSDSLMGRGLNYMTADDLVTNTRWPVILGDPNASPPVPPSDPFMVEQIDPRPTGTPNPVVPSVTILAKDSTQLNAINGHEQGVLDARDDLQFACIFDLAKPVSSADCAANPDGCDCNIDELDKNSPLCMGTTATVDGSQVRAKAYPGVRELQVLKDFGNNSIVASICPKNIQPAQGKMKQTDPDYGYNPAVGAIVERLKEALTVKCLPRPLAPDTEGQANDPNAPNYNPDLGKVPCAVVEARPQQTDMNGAFVGCPDPSCMNPGRTALTGDNGTKIQQAALSYLSANGVCGGSGNTPCADECFCLLNQFTGTDLVACETGNATNGAGYCYVDPAAATDAATQADSDQGASITAAEQTIIDGENNLVKSCLPTQRRILNFVGDNIPAKDGLAFIACIGATPQE
jgi:hypothetical protein